MRTATTNAHVQLKVCFLLLLFKASAKIGTFSDFFHSNVHEKIALGMLKI